jgi:hypothetical protein
MLGEHMVAAKQAGAKRVRLDIDPDGVMSIGPGD